MGPRKKNSKIWFTVSQFFQATNLPITVTHLKKSNATGGSVTVTVAPLQLGTVFAEHRAQIIFLKYFSTRTVILSSILVHLPEKYAHSVCNEDAEDTTIFSSPDAITIALLGQYWSSCTE